MPTQPQIDWLHALGQLGGPAATTQGAPPGAKASRTAEQIKAEFAKVYATTSAAKTDAWLAELSREVAGNPELERVATSLRELVLKRRAARAEKAAQAARPPAGEPTGRTAEPPAPPSAAPPASKEPEGLLDEIEDVAERAVTELERLAGAAGKTLEDAWQRWTEEPEAAPIATPGPVAPPKEAGGPKFNGYPKGLEAAEKLITQVKRYGFGEGIHATSSDAEDRGDVKEIWCSGLSNWSLLESSIDVDQKYEYPTGRMVKDKKSGAMVPETKPLSIRSMVEGGYDSFGKRPVLEPMPTEEDYPDPDELKLKIKEAKARNKAASEKALKEAYDQEKLFGKTAADDDPRIKGAAGAFVIAKIGTEVLDLKDVKPGDYCQTRVVRSPAGHAFQIHACECVGEALIGPSGSPKLIKDLGGERISTPDGIWYGKAQFKIDGKTDPAYVGKHEVVKNDILESNEPSMMEDRKKHPDGGVQVNHDTEFPDPLKTGRRTYVGRLNSSSWAGYVRTNPSLERPEGGVSTEGT